MLGFVQHSHSQKLTLFSWQIKSTVRCHFDMPIDIADFSFCHYLLFAAQSASYAGIKIDAWEIRKIYSTDQCTQISPAGLPGRKRKHSDWHSAYIRVSYNDKTLAKRTFAMRSVETRCFQQKNMGFHKHLMRKPHYTHNLPNNQQLLFVIHASYYLSVFYNHTFFFKSQKKMLF